MGSCHPATSRSYPHVRRTTARAPPAILPRPWVGSRPVRLPTCVLAANSSLSSVPYRDPTGLLTGCCCASLCPGVRLSVRSSSSRPLAAAGAFSASSCVSSTVEYAVPRVRNGQAVFSSMAQALARLTPRTAAAPGERKNANPGKRICSRIEGSIQQGKMSAWLH